MGFSMDGKERLMDGVLKGKLSIVDEVLSEHFYSFDNRAEILRVAIIKLHEARKLSIEAESIVDILEVGAAANEEIPDKGFSTVENSISMFKMVDAMADGSEEARKILAGILTSQEGSMRYIFDLDRMGIKGSDIVAVYDLSEKNMLKFFDLLDYESDRIISHLAKFNSTGEKE